MVETQKTALVTIVHGRHQHLRRQREFVRRLQPAPLAHVVVSMGDPQIVQVAGDDAVVVMLPEQEHLPLAAARNRGVLEATRLGATAVVLLDVDCLPAPSLLADYAQGFAAVGTDPAVLSGRVRYLPEGLGETDHTLDKMREVGRDHPSRPLPGGASPEPADPALLWSLNLAVRVPDWERIGGFDESYVGYGGEDTDFGQRMRAAGGTLWFLRGAEVFHQWHTSERPPLRHLADIVRNATLFHERWGWFPMEGWLEEFEARGLVRREAGGLVVTDR